MFTRATLLALAVTAIAAPSPDAEPIHIPVARRGGLQPLPDGSANIEALLLELNRTLIKYKADHTLHPLEHYMHPEAIEERANEKRAIKNEPLTDQVEQGFDIAYYGLGSAGGQKFTIDFDTGSADLFVPGPKCTTCKGKPYEDKGINQNRTTSVRYGSGSITGNNYFDTVCVAGLCAPHTNLISLTSAAGFSTLASSSLMGMGFQTISESNEPTFFERLIALKKVTTNEFSFYLGRSKSKTTKLSQMTLGGRDKSRYTGKFSKVPVTKQGYWQVTVDGLAVNKRKSILSSAQAAIDTGTSAIIAPTVATTALFTSIGGIALPVVATGSLSETAFAFPCGYKGSIQIIMGGKRFAINPLDLSIGQITPGVLKKFKLPLISEGLCAASIIGAQIMGLTENFYVVGDSFLKNWYTTFNFDNGASVQFAAAKYNQ